jgi:intergrase/recombinase
MDKSVYADIHKTEDSDGLRYTWRKNGIPQELSVDWKAFRKWLARDHTEQVTRDTLNYAQKHIDSLMKMDLSEVALFSPGKRRMVMASLSALAKFLGIYENWQQLTRQYSLKWAGRSSADIVIDRLTKVQDPNEMFQWIKEVKAARPELSDFLDLMAVTGMRMIEAVSCYNLIIELTEQGKLSEYYDSEREILEHYKFKDLFIRKGKKVFISFVPKDLVQRIGHNETLKSRDCIQKAVAYKGFKQRFADVREAHGSFVTKYLQPSEIDFLHGRIGVSVFQQNYFNIQLVADLKERVFKGIREILRNTS